MQRFPIEHTALNIWQHKILLPNLLKDTLQNCPCTQKTYPFLSNSIQASRAEMTKTTSARYTLEFKRKAVRLVESRQSMAAARTLGIVQQTLFN